MARTRPTAREVRQEVVQRLEAPVDSATVIRHTSRDYHEAEDDWWKQLGKIERALLKPNTIPAIYPQDLDHKQTDWRQVFVKLLAPPEWNPYRVFRAAVAQAATHVARMMEDRMSDVNKIDKANRTIVVTSMAEMNLDSAQSARLRRAVNNVSQTSDTGHDEAATIYPSAYTVL